MPQPRDRPPVPLAAMIDQKIAQRRRRRLSRRRAAAACSEAWRRGLAALDAEAQAAHRRALSRAGRGATGRAAAAMQHGERAARRVGRHAAPNCFFKQRMLHDIVSAYYAHPDGLERDRLRRSGQPARLCADGFQPARSVGSRGSAARATRRERGGRIAMSADPPDAPRATDGRAPDVFRAGGWVPMRQYRDDEAGRFRHRRHRRRRRDAGLQAGGSGLLGGRASMPAPTAGRLRISPPTRREQGKLYWTDDRIVDGANPLAARRATTAARRSAASTVHFAMVSLRFRPEWFKARSKLGYGADWPLDWREMWHYYAEVEQALKISGPVSYPWGPKRPRYPYRAARTERRRAGAGARLRGAGHRMDADAAGDRFGAARPVASLRLSRFCVHRLLDQRQAERAGHVDPARAGSRRRDPRPRDGRARRSRSCRAGDRCALSSRGPLALSAGPERRGRRLCDRDAAAAAEFRQRRFPDGLANQLGLVGKYLMVQSNQAVWGVMEREIRWYKGPPSLALTEHWNYDDAARISSAATAI